MQVELAATEADLDAGGTGEHSVADDQALLLWEHYEEANLRAGKEEVEPIDGACDRVRFTLSLWPYMVPLGLVYFSEYTMQVRHGGRPE